MKGRHRSEAAPPRSRHRLRTAAVPVLNHTRIHILSLTNTLAPLTNFPCVSAVSSLRRSPRRPSHPLFRVIEYRSLALPQCVSECACGPVCLTEALQGHCHGNLSKGSSCCSVTVHRSEGSHEKKGDCRGAEGGWRALTSGGKRTPEGWNSLPRIQGRAE